MSDVTHDQVLKALAWPEYLRRSYVRVPSECISSDNKSLKLPTAKQLSGIRRQREKILSLIKKPPPIKVINTDWRLDDRIAVRWLRVGEKNTKLMVVAGQQFPFEDTYDSVSREMEVLTRKARRSTKGRAESKGCSVIPGASLRGGRDAFLPPGEMTEERRREEMDRDQQAAASFRQELGGEKFALWDMTTHTWWHALSDADRNQCLFRIASGGPTFFDTKHGTGANAYIDTAAYKASNERAGVPHIYVHPTTLGIQEHSLSQLPGWLRTLEKSEASISEKQDMIRAGMRDGLVLSACLHGRDAGLKGDGVVKHLQDLLTSIIQGGKQPEWVKEALKSKNFSEGEIGSVTYSLGTLQARLDCPYNNSLTDVTAPLIGPDMSDDFDIVSFHVDEAGRLRASLDANDPYILVQKDGRHSVSLKEEWLPKDLAKRHTLEDLMKDRNFMSVARKIIDSQMRSELKTYRELCSHLTSNSSQEIGSGAD